jgi:hypothetical protein
LIINEQPTVVSPLITNLKEFNQRKFMIIINTKIREGRSCKGSSFWLTTPPNVWNKTVIEAAAFRMLLKYSLGMPLFSGIHNAGNNRINLDIML